MKLKIKLPPIVKKHWPFLIFFFASLFVFGLWLLSFYPGTMSPDSSDQWYQATTLHFLDDHPYVHTLYILVFQRIFGSPVAVAIFQILITSVFFSYVSSYFWHHGVSKKLIIFLFLLFVTSVPIGIFNITLWKDVPFSLAVVASSFFVFKIYYEKRFLWGDFIVLLVVSLTATFFRHNGLVFAFFIPLAVMLYFSRGSRKWLFILMFVIISSLLKFLVPTLLQVEKMPLWFNYSSIYQPTAGFYAYLPSTSVTDKTRELFRTFTTSEKIKQAYFPTSVNSLYATNVLSPELLKSSSLVNFWEPLSKEYPRNVIQNLNFFIGDKTTMFLTATLGYGQLYCDSISPTPTQYYLDIFMEPGYKQNIVQKPLLTGLNKKLSFLMEEIKRRPLPRLLIWNSLIPIILLLCLTVDSLYRKKRHFLAYASVMLVQLPILFVASPSDNWRYFYFYYLSFFLTLPIYLLKSRSDS